MLLSIRDKLAKITASGIRTHVRTNQRRVLDRGRGNMSSLFIYDMEALLIKGLLA